MLCWYADNSELDAGYGAEIPDLLILGGLAIEESIGILLRKRLIEVKRELGEGFVFPVKWNFKDLEDWFQQHNKSQLFGSLLAESKNIRNKIFDILKEYDFTIILSCLIAYSNRRTVLKKTREQLTGYVFAGGLMRFALHIQESSSKEANIVLDWPDKKNPNPFNSEYNSAYYNGTSVKEIKYRTGSLESLGFSDSPFYANMTENSLLQVSDLIVGASRDFIEVALGKRENALGVDLLRKIVHKFRGAPNSIVGRGISVSPSQGNTRKKIEEGIKRLLLQESA